MEQHKISKLIAHKKLQSQQKLYFTPFAGKVLSVDIFPGEEVSPGKRLFSVLLTPSDEDGDTGEIVILRSHHDNVVKEVLIKPGDFATLNTPLLQFF